MLIVLWLNHKHCGDICYCRDISQMILMQKQVTRVWYCQVHSQKFLSRAFHSKIVRIQFCVFHVYSVTLPFNCIIHVSERIAWYQTLAPAPCHMWVITFCSKLVKLMAGFFCHIYLKKGPCCHQSIICGSESNGWSYLLSRKLKCRGDSVITEAVKTTMFTAVNKTISPFK